MDSGWCLITGCNSRLGAEIALKAAGLGYGILAHYHSSRARIDSLASRIERLQAVKADLGSAQGIETLCKIITEQKGSIRALVNNAATIGSESKLSEINLSLLENVFRVNAFAPALLGIHALEAMKESGGKIINISSIAAKYGGGETTLPYGLSKAALEGLTQGLSRAGLPYGILVNTIRAGLIDTDFHSKQTPGKDMNARVAKHPMGRMARPEEIAAMVGLLLSDQGNYIAGETLTVSGGE